MDKKKKKKSRKTKRVSAGDVEEHAADNLVGSDDSLNKAEALDPEEKGYPSSAAAFDHSDALQAEAGDKTPAKYNPFLSNPAENAHCFESVQGVDGSRVVNITHDGGKENEGYVWPPQVDSFGDGQMQAVLTQTAHEQTLVIEQTVFEMKKLREALSLQRDTSELLRDQLICVQGKLANIEALEVGTRGKLEQLIAEIERLTAENLELHNLVDRIAQMEQMTTDIKKLTAKHGVFQTQIGDARAEVLRLAAENADHQNLAVGTRAEINQLTTDVRRLVADNAELRSWQVCTQGEMGRVSAENVELQKMAMDSEKKIRELQDERRQMSSKMMTLETGMQQLEQKATLKAHVVEDLAAATTVASTKQWEGWSMKDPIAMAAAVAEEARLQKLFVTQTIDKLLEENDELIKKVNEQAGVINDLTLQHESVSDGPVKINSQKQTLPTSDGAWSGLGAENGNGVKSDNINGYHLDDIIPYKQNASEMESPMHTLVEDPPMNLMLKPPKYRGVEEDFLPVGIPVEPVEIVHGRVNESKRGPVLGTKIVKAPMRIISFVTGYISGKDLVKN